MKATSSTVIPGLDPGIHAMTGKRAWIALARSLIRNGVDGRVKPGHDGSMTGVGVTCGALLLRSRD